MYFCRYFLLLVSIILLSSCSVFGNKEYEQQLKSPCASTNGGPCKHIPVNDWWLKGSGGGVLL